MSKSRRQELVSPLESQQSKFYNKVEELRNSWKIYLQDMQMVSALTGTTRALMLTGTTRVLMFTCTTCVFVFSGTTRVLMFTGTTRVLMFTGTTRVFVLTGTTRVFVLTGTTLVLILKSLGITSTIMSCWTDTHIYIYIYVRFTRCWVRLLSWCTDI
jgi:hypothetical protein